MSGLGWAVKNGDLEKVKELIENQVRFCVCIVKHIETEKLHVIYFRVVIVRYIIPFLLVGGCVFLIAITNLDNYSFRHIVLNVYHVRNEWLIFRYLFQGMKVNEDIDGRSPMHYAADYGQIEVLQYLVSKK